MYGCLALLRTVYRTVVVWDKDWETLTKDVIRLCYSVWRVVSSVVVSDSPEGHLPSDNTWPSLSPPKEQSSSEMTATITSNVVLKEVWPDEIAQEIVDELVSTVLGEQRDVNSAVENITNGLGQVTMNGESDENVDATEEEEEDLSECGASKAKEVSSQMLLLCSWRCVKEISLFLSELCSTYKPGAVNIISVRQVLEVSNFLLDLLTDTKHRGAFEQAFVAFSSLCSFLWRCPEPQLHSQPQTMLEDVLTSVTDLQVSTKPSLCSTRRSAGLPFILQAVVTSDLKSSGSVLRLTMERLLGTAGNTEAELESRLHCLNILRALVRDSKLGDTITSFIETALKVSVTGFKSSNWAERNASTLLFSALMTRIFGVKREKDTLSSKNCLTGKIFFQRYPSLYEFFLSQLSESASGQTGEGGVLVVDSSVYPVLLVLSRIETVPALT